MSLAYGISFISHSTHSALTFLGCKTGLNFIFGFGGPAAPAFPSPLAAAPVLGPAAALAAVELPGGAGLAKAPPIPPALGGMLIDFWGD